MKKIISIILTLAILSLSFSSILLVSAENDITEHLTDDFTYLKNGTNNQDFYSFDARTRCGDTLVYSRTATNYGTQVAIIKGQNSERLTLESNTEYVISIDYKVNNIGDTISNDGTSTKQFIDVWLARVLNSSEGGISTNARYVNLAGTISGAYSAANGTTTANYSKDNGLVISETAVTNGWKTVVYSFTTYDFANDTGTYSNNANKLNKDWDELALWFRGTGELEIDNIRLAKKADLATKEFILTDGTTEESLGVAYGFTGTAPFKAYLEAGIEDYYSFYTDKALTTRYTGTFGDNVSTLYIRDISSTEHIANDFTYLKNGTNNQDFYSFDARTRCGDTLVYNRTATGYSTQIAIIKDQNSERLTLESNTEYVISIDYKVNNIGNTISNDGTSTKQFIDVWLARVLNSSEGGISTNARYVNLAGTISGAYSAANGTTTASYSKDNGLVISETAVTNGWKTVAYSFTTYDFANDTGTYSNNANKSNKDWDELALWFRGTGELEIDNIRVAKKADLATITVKDIEDNEVEHFVGFTGTNMDNGFAEDEIVAMYEKTYFADINCNTVFDGTFAGDRVCYLKKGYLDISDFTSATSPYNVSAFKEGSANGGAYNNMRWGTVSGNTLDTDSNGMLKYKYSYTDANDSGKVGSRTGKNGHVATAVAVMPQSETIFKLLPNQKYILQFDYFVEEIDTASLSTASNMIVLAERIGEVGVTDLTRRYVNSDGTINAETYSNNSVLITDKVSTDWQTVTYEFTTYNWVGSTTGDSATDNYLSLSMRGYGTAYIDNIKLATASENNAINNAAKINYKDKDSTVLNTVYGIPGTDFNVNSFNIVNAEVLGYYNESTFSTKFVGNKFVDGTDVYVKDFLSINAFTTTGSKYNINSFKSGTGGKYNHNRWSVVTNGLDSDNNGVLRYQYTYNTTSNANIGSAAGTAGRVATAVAVLNNDGNFFELSPNKTYKLSFDYYVKSVDTSSDTTADKIVIRADRAADDIKTPERRILEDSYTIAGAYRFDTELANVTSVTDGWQSIDYTFTTCDFASDTNAANQAAKNLVLQISGYGEVYIDNIRIISEDDGAVIVLNDDNTVLDKIVGVPGEELNISDPLKENRYFQGWYTDADYLNAYTETIFGTTSTLTNLYAKWDFPGDVNGDNSVNVIDLVRMKKYIAGISVEINFDNAEMTLDTMVNALDLSILRQYLLGNKDFVLNSNIEDPTIFNFADNNYKIVTPKYNMSYLVTLELENLVGAINNKYGISIETVSDDTTAEEIEIVVDKTNRRTNLEFKYLDNYFIEYVDGKIYVDGGQNYAVVAGVKKLTEIINNGYQLKEGTKIIGKSSADQDVQGYYLKSSDEFSTNTLNSMWRVNDDTEPSNGEGSLSNVRRSGRTENLSVNNGKLNQYLTKDSSYYYGARVSTDDSLWFQYGYTEVSAKIPNGEGFSSAFYLYGLTTPGSAHPEYDILESFGDSTEVRFTPFAHMDEDDSVIYWPNSVTYQNDRWYTLDNDDSFSEAYHTFGLEWNETTYKFIVDGKVIAEIDYSGCEEEYKAIYQQPVYVMLGCAAGLTKVNASNNPDNAFAALGIDESISNNFSIDYFHLYQTQTQKTSTNSTGF